MRVCGYAWERGGEGQACGLPWQAITPTVVDVDCSVSVLAHSILHPQPLQSADIATWVALHAAIIIYFVLSCRRNTKMLLQAVEHLDESRIIKKPHNTTTM